MFRFQHPEYLWALALLAPILGLYGYYLFWRGRNLEKLGRPDLIRQLRLQWVPWVNPLKFVLLALAYVFIVLGFANPQLGTRQEKVTRRGIDVVIALDVSNSMLCEDIKPNRLIRAKNFISNFIEHLRNDRVALVVFAGKAYLQMPLTVDFSAARMFLNSIHTNMIPTQGTHIGEAIEMARQALQSDDDKGMSKVLIIISDGEDNEGGVEEALENALSENIHIFTVGVGTETGAPIPVGNDYKRDQDGNIVLTKMNEAMLRDIASRAKGKYYRLNSGKEEAQAIIRELGKMTTSQYDEMVFTDFDHQFQWMLGIALALLIAEWWISERNTLGIIDKVKNYFNM
ncbi:MAG: VWA domain-containing protein [Chitinophagales bacterium]|nr:VWA domain-containing protein [Chitinophagales bacterium]MDW8418011.1 VWA domain-containing protein [Chitinophagales bacterium]